MNEKSIIPPPPPHLIGNDEWVIGNRHAYKKYCINECIIKNKNRNLPFLCNNQYIQSSIYNLKCFTSCIIRLFFVRHR